MKAPDCAARYVHDRAGSAASPGESCLLRGCAELYGITGEKVFRDYILQRCEAFAEDAKEILGFPECASGLFFALDQTGDARFREAIERCRGLCSAAGAAPDRFDVMLPFYAAYEMRFGGKREIGNVAGIFGRFRETLYDEQRGFTPRARASPFRSFSRRGCLQRSSTAPRPLTNSFSSTAGGSPICSGRGWPVLSPCAAGRRACMTRPPGTGPGINPILRSRRFFPMRPSRA